MSDNFALSLTVELPADMTEAELTELRWHLGLGSQPGVLQIVTDFSEVEINEDGEPVVVNRPEPLLAGRGAAWSIGGELSAALDPSTEPPGLWVLTARQELHPDQFDRLGELLIWLADRSGGTDPVQVGQIRFEESDQDEPLLVTERAVNWP